MPLRIGTRGSALALAQADRVISLLESEGVAAKRVIITTHGDTATGVPLHEIGGQGVFVRALDDAIIDGRIDAAVHSMKDIPAKRPAGLVTCAVLPRDSPADFLVHAQQFQKIRRIGTSSTRRKAQLLMRHPEWRIEPLRGNVDTRLRKLRDRAYDAVVLAEAGLQRLGLCLPGTRLAPEMYVPSPNQGTIAVVSREGDDSALLARVLDHLETRKDVAFERVVMEEVGGGCFTPQGVYCRKGHIRAEILSLDGCRRVRREGHLSSADDARTFGQLLRRDALDLIQEAYMRLGLKE
ncbi:MAG: porphobilinogen deaminase [Methanoregulaceae archaeon PtaB.Bin056]|nr:MAG: porphobilinogen deaminase [Methanoregulaceae archaeon PtaB.Bin056]